MTTLELFQVITDGTLVQFIERIFATVQAYPFSALVLLLLVREYGKRSKPRAQERNREWNR